MRTGLEKYNRILYISVILASLLLVPDISLGGISLFLSVVLLIVVGLVFLNMGRRIPSGEHLKQIIKHSWPVLFLVGYAIYKFISSFFVLQIASGLSREFYILLLISCLLYWVLQDRQKLEPFWIDMIIYAGGVVTLGILIYFLGAEYLANWIPFVKLGTGTVASYLMPISILSIWRYCFWEKRTQTIPAFIIAGISFFTLLLNQNHASLWILVLVFMAIPCIYRPRADMIKRDMQLFFLFAFLWCNMSLLTNYTDLIKRPLSYGLEAGVYMELVLSVGGVMFFHFWDMIPEGKKLHNISMVRMQRYYRRLFIVFVLFITGMILCGNHLSTLSDKGVYGFCKTLFLPLFLQLQTESGSFFLVLQDPGPIIILVLLIFLVLLGKRIYANIHVDKKISNMLFLLYIVFVATFFLWKISLNIVPIYVILLTLGSGIEETPARIRERRIQNKRNGGDNQNEKKE